MQIGVDRNDLNKVFIQLTLEFLAKQVLFTLTINNIMQKSDRLFFTFYKSKLLTKCNYMCPTFEAVSFNAFVADFHMWNLVTGIMKT